MAREQGAGFELYSVEDTPQYSPPSGRIVRVPRRLGEPLEGRLSRSDPKVVLYGPDGTLYPARHDESSPRTQETTFAELSDGSVVELVRIRRDEHRIRFVIWNSGKVRYTDEVSTAGERLFVPQRHNDILEKLVLPSEMAPCQPVVDLAHTIRRVIRACVSLSNPYPSLLAAFCIYTWVADRLSNAVYVYITGLPESGKTTLLKVLRLFCRRSLYVVDANAEGVYTTCSVFAPTLMIDEEDFDNHGLNRGKRRVMRGSSTSDGVKLRSGSCWNAFGPRIFCGENLPDDPALLRRCIVVPMAECDTSKLKKPGDPEIVELSQQVQNQLLAFRLDMLKKVHAATVPGAERLGPGRRDLLSALGAPFAGDPDWPDLLLQCFENSGHEWLPSLQPFEAAVWDGLWAASHLLPGYQYVYSLQLANLITKVYKEAGQEIAINAINVGIYLRHSGIQARTHRNIGNGFWLNAKNRQLIHEHVRKYGLTLPPSYWSGIRHFLASTASCLQRIPACRPMTILQRLTNQAERRSEADLMRGLKSWKLVAM